MVPTPDQGGDAIFEEGGSDEQAWLLKRLDGLRPDDFDAGSLIFCTGALRPPAAFGECWRDVLPETSTVHDGAQVLTESEASELQAILIFCNHTNEAEVDRLRGILDGFDSLGHDAPPVYWVPHSVDPRSRLDKQAQFVDDGLVRDLLRAGLDGIILGEPEGHALAYHVRAKMRETTAAARSLQNMMEQAETTQYLQSCIDRTLWDYVRVRMCPLIPPINNDLPPGQPTELPGFTFGDQVGKGACGFVFALHEAPSQGGGLQVAKVLAKDSVTKVQDVRWLNRMVHVMGHLSSESAYHPGLIALHETYHTPTHIVFRMGYGGPENLYRRLYRREAAQPERYRPLPLAKLTSILRQCMEVLVHLHRVARVAHRDIKPENITVAETPESITIKLTDYDLAIICAEGTRCRSACGTLPFAAPEVLTSKEYDGRAADVWSMGIVLLEALCGCRVVERAVWGSSQPNQQGTSSDDVRGRAEAIRSYFEAQGTLASLLEASARQELRSLVPTCSPLLAGMIQVDATRRVDADEAQMVLLQGLAFTSGAVVAPSGPAPTRRPHGRPHPQ